MPRMILSKREQRLAANNVGSAFGKRSTMPLRKLACLARLNNLPQGCCRFPLAHKHPNRTVAGVDSLEAPVTQENAVSAKQRRRPFSNVASKKRS